MQEGAIKHIFLSLGIGRNIARSFDCRHACVILSVDGKGSGVGRSWGRFSALSTPVKIVVASLLLGAAVLFSPLLALLAFSLPLISVLAILMRAARRRPLRRWGIADGLSLLSLLVFSGISGAIYGSAPEQAPGATGGGLRWLNRRRSPRVSSPSPTDPRRRVRALRHAQESRDHSGARRTESGGSFLPAPVRSPPAP